MHMRVIARVCSFLFLGLIAGPLLAQAYRAKPVRFILPFPPGGPTDMLGRLVGQKLSENEAGFPGYEVTSWYGILTPAGTTREIVVRLNAELEKVMKSPDVRERMATAGLDPVTSTPERFGEFLKTEIARYAKVIREANLIIEQ